MNLRLTILIVFSFWLAVGLGEFVPLVLAFSFLITLWLLHFFKSRPIRVALIILSFSLLHLIVKNFTAPPLFLRYYQTFNPSLTDFTTPILTGKSISTYQLGFQNKLVFSELNWFSDGERMIHTSAIQPFLLVQHFLQLHNVNTFSYFGPAPEELCKRIKHLNLNIKIYYAEPQEPSAACGDVLATNQIFLDSHIVTYGPVESNHIKIWTENFKSHTNTPWSIWVCSEGLSNKNPRKLPLLSDLSSSAQEFYIEFPFLSCEIKTSPGFIKKYARIFEDPIINRLLMKPNEAL